MNIIKQLLIRNLLVLFVFIIIVGSGALGLKLAHDFNVAQQELTETITNKN